MMGARAVVRWGRAFAGALACAAAITACGSNAVGSPSAGAAEQRLAADVLDVMDHNGLPVMDDYVSCRAGPAPGNEVCYGLTDGATAHQVEGLFRPGEPGGCRGALVVEQDGSVVQRVVVDPCR